VKVKINCITINFAFLNIVRRNNGASIRLNKRFVGVSGVKVGDEFSCLVLTRVTRENMIVLISEDVESEVVGVGDVDMVIMTEENIRVVFAYSLFPSFG
jgi:hypothetical protein